MSKVNKPVVDSIECVLSKTQVTQLKGVVASIVQLEIAEKVFDTGAKGLISMFDEVFKTIDKSKGNMSVRAKAVESSMLTVLSTMELTDSVDARSKLVVSTISNAISNGVLLKTDLIPFTLIQRVVKLVVGGSISKKELTALSKVEDAKYPKACQDLCTKGDYKALCGSVDFSMLDEGLVDVVKGLDKTSLAGLAGLIKVQVGA